MLRSLARACTLMAGWTIALGVSSCSLLLDWSGYTGGDARSGDGDRADDAAGALADAEDAVDELDGADDLDSPSDRETSEAAVLEPCTPKKCGGCCTSDDFCAGGGSAATCGTGGRACVDCASMGERCDQGVCSAVDSGAVDSGALPMCTDDAQCRSMFTLCIPGYQISCCLPDGTCGCQVQIPKLGMCM